MSLNPFAAPWWPEGYDGAGPSCEPDMLDHPSTSTGEISQQDPVRSAGKKAFIRACNKAYQLGIERYRGHWHSLNSLGCTGGPPPVRHPKPSNVSQPTVSCHKRLMYCTWNCGGLNPARFDELRLWSDRLALDLEIITETH